MLAVFDASGAQRVALYGPDGAPLLTAASPGTVQGPAAHDAVAAGNPLRLGGVYRVSAPTVADGDVVDLLADDAGRLYVRSADGHVEALGATTDAEATGNGSLIAIAKRLRTLLAGGLPAALTAGGNLKAALQEIGGQTPAMIQDGSAYAQAVGRRGASVTLINASQIRDTNMVASGFASMSHITGRKTIEIASSLNQNITRIDFYVRNGGGSAYIYYSNTLAISNNGAFITSGSAPAGAAATMIQVPQMDLPWTQMQIVVQCSVAPTSGSVSVYLFGAM